MKTTACTECRIEVRYTTNKPKRCESCKEKREKNFTFKKKNPLRSKKEGQMQQILNKILPDEEYIDNGYYSWLMSPKGSPLQLDRYYPDLKVGFELTYR